MGRVPRGRRFGIHGSKWRLAPWIIGFFPRHESYVEAYGGSAAVLLRKSRSWLEVYNDQDGQVVNFFRILRERTEELVEAIRLTPYARTEWELARALKDDSDPMEQARAFYIMAVMNFAGPTAQGRSGWRRQKIVGKNGRKNTTPAAISFTRIDHLHEVAERLRGVQVECDNALSVIERYDSPTTLFYLDPPYPSSTRSAQWKEKAYAHEMTDAEHCELACRLCNLEGMVVISGYQCELYDGLYADWRRVDKRVRINNWGGGSAVESLWLSPATFEASMPLFSSSVAFNSPP